MDDTFFKDYQNFSQINVSRETCVEFEHFISMIQEKNKQINLISKNTSNTMVLRERHIIDSAQIIDFVDFNSNTTCDLGSGAGLPGLVIAILLKELKKNLKICLYEKSFHKSRFLEDVSKKLNLNTEIIQKDIFKVKKVKTGTIMSRAFKPMPAILEIVNKNFSKYQNLILFMGKSGEKNLKEISKNWFLDYEKKNSLTNKDSFILNIKKIEKKKI